MGRRRRNSEFNESAGMNNASYNMYYDRLVQLGISMFKWENLPDTVDERFMELTLFNDGLCVFFKDEDLGFLALKCAIGGELNVYKIPTLRDAYADNGYYLHLDDENSVIIFNNMLHTPSHRDVEIFAKRLYNLDRIVDVNANAQKTPILLQCEESQRLTLKNLYMQYDGNAPVIYGDKGMNPNGLKTLTTGAPYVCDKIYELKTQIWNEALTYLGISNISFQKKERMVSDEVIRSLGGTIANRYTRLNPRVQAAEQINKMFGLNIKVSYREDYREIDDEFMIAGETGNNELDNIATDIRSRSGSNIDIKRGVV